MDHKALITLTWAWIFVGAISGSVFVLKEIFYGDAILGGNSEYLMIFLGWCAIGAFVTVVINLPISVLSSFIFVDLSKDANNPYWMYIFIIISMITAGAYAYFILDEYLRIGGVYRQALRPGIFIGGPFVGWFMWKYKAYYSKPSDSI